MPKAAFFRDAGPDTELQAATDSKAASEETACWLDYLLGYRLLRLRPLRHLLDQFDDSVHDAIVHSSYGQEKGTRIALTRPWDEKNEKNMNSDDDCERHPEPSVLS